MAEQLRCDYGHGAFRQRHAGHAGFGGGDQPTGAAVSSLTNPDGTYRIDGIPAGNYLLYVHPLPPDAVPADGTGLRPPRDQNGGQFLPNGVFGTVFYPNTTDPNQATLNNVVAGSVISGPELHRSDAKLSAGL